MALCYLGPLLVFLSPTMPMYPKALLCSGTPVAQLTGRLLKIMRGFFKAVPGQLLPRALLDVLLPAPLSLSIGLNWPVSRHIAITYVHSHLSSFVEVRLQLRK